MRRIFGSGKRVLATLVIVGFSLTCPAEDRLALVIGNGDYRHARKLRNAPNDAGDVSAALERVGWKVTLVEDADVREMIRALRLFCESATGAESALFFYAGHGIEVKGRNYLLPIDAKLSEDDGEDALPLETVSLKKVLGDLAAARIRLKTVVLDCCRDDPLSRSWLASRSAGGGGLAEVTESQLPEGAMLVFSTAPGKTASDGSGQNSPFTAELLKRMKAGSGSVADVFGDVAMALGRRQPAWIRFDGSGLSFTAFRTYPLVPEGELPGKSDGMQPESPALGLAGRLRAATKDSPFVNSLGLEFVPIPGRGGVLMCRTETRLRDFKAFTEATSHDAGEGAFTLESGGWKQAGGSWSDPRIPDSVRQTDDHPVVCVSWEDARAFCEWLSEKEPGLTYRLPTDAEWSTAAGSAGKYPWGSQWPPPNGAGNYAGSEANLGAFASNDYRTIEGYDDGVPRTARVGSFAANRFGFYDLGGNVWEWCEDWYRDSMNDPDVVAHWKEGGYNDRGGQEFRVLRGGSWFDDSGMYLRSSCRISLAPSDRRDYGGFRVVVFAGTGG